MRLLLITTLFIVIQCALLAQSPYRVFALDCNLNSETERQTASLVTKAFLLNHLEFVKDSKRVKPYAPLDWAEFQRVIDSLQAKIPINSEYSWEEDYGLKTPPAPKHERWKEITFYESDFERNGDLKAIVNGKRKYILQIKINLDANGQIESIQYIKGKDMKNREAFILHAYKILYKPVKKQ